MTRERLPNRRLNVAFSFEFEGRCYCASAGRFPDGRLAELFLDCGKPNTALQNNAETAAVLTSLLLQNGVHPDTVRHSINGPIAIALEYFTKIAVFS